MLTAMLRKNVAVNPTKTAVVQGSRRLSYRELECAARRYAGLLKQAGVGPADTIAVVLPNCAEFVIAFFAIARLHAVMLALNPQYTTEELRRFLADRPAKLLITDTVRAARCTAAAGRAQILDMKSESASSSEKDSTPLEFLEPFDGDALCLYTSGSTGSLKRVCATQRNLFHEAHNFVESTQIGPNDTILCTVPLYHSYGMGNCLLDAAYTGATLVLPADSDAPFAARYQEILRLLAEEHVRIYPGVPFQFEVLAGAPEDVRAAFRRVRWCISSGDVLPKRTFDRFLARTGHPIRSLYGSTEAGSICMDTRDASQVRFGSLGGPLRNVTIQIRGDHPTGQVWVKSPVIPPAGYENAPEINAEVFRDGFYNTGDLGQMEDGRLVMTGRKQTYFDVGGHKVDLTEVEAALLAHPLVREAAAVGIEVAQIGGVIKGVVCADEALSEPQVLDHCRARLASYKVPRFVEFRDSLPRSPLGKVLRKELSAPACWLSDVPSAREIPDLPRRQQQEWLARRVQEQVGSMLRCPPESIARGVPFQTLGFDSLRAIELQDRLIRMSGIELSITTLWNYTSIDAFAEYLLAQMLGTAHRELRRHDSLDDLGPDQLAELLAHELNRTDSGTEL